MRTGKGYRCKTSCLENSEKKVEIFCNCFIKSGPFNLPKKCEWIWSNDQGCSTIKTEVSKKIENN